MPRDLARADQRYTVVQYFDSFQVFPFFLVLVSIEKEKNFVRGLPSLQIRSHCVNNALHLSHLSGKVGIAAIPSFPEWRVPSRARDENLSVARPWSGARRPRGETMSIDAPSSST